MRKIKKVNLAICTIWSLIFVIFAQADEDVPQYIVRFEGTVLTLQENNVSSSLSVLTAHELEEALAAGEVEWYEEDYEVELFEEDTDLRAEKWDLEMISALRAKETGCMGQGVSVAVIDSGVNTHPDLIGNLKQGYNFINKNTDVTDNIGHGTFVSGLIASEVNGIGFDGVAPNATVVPLKCFDTDVTTRVSMICNAIYAAVDEYDCHIINMSLGLTQYSETLQEAINYAISNGVIIVSAAGNNGGETLYYPAAFDGVIGVGAIDSNGIVASFSQHNESVFVTAPGEGVLSTSNTGGYTTKNGTSFSTPIVAGLVAVILNVDPTLTNDEIMQVLSETATDSGEEGYDYYYGHGIVNVANAIDKLLEANKFFVSPIWIEEDDAYAVVLNNTETAVDYVCLWGRYENDIMKSVCGKNISIAAGDTVSVKCSFSTGQIKCLVWNSINEIRAITCARVWEEEQ